MSEDAFNVTGCLSEMSARLIDAAAIAKAALTCAQSGSEHEAVRIAFDLGELLSEAVTLHGAVCLMGRIRRARVEHAAPAC